MNDHQLAPRPRDVRIVHPDHTETPVELTYVGTENGVHCWKGAARFVVGADELSVGFLPARTAILLPTDDPDPTQVPSRRVHHDPVPGLMGLLRVAAAAYLLLLVFVLTWQVIS